MEYVNKFEKIIRNSTISNQYEIEGMERIEPNLTFHSMATGLHGMAIFYCIILYGVNQQHFEYSTVEVLLVLDEVIACLKGEDIHDCLDLVLNCSHPQDDSLCDG